MDSYRDATRPIADRVADLLSRMTLREKAEQMNQKMLGWQALERRAGRLEPTRAFEEEVALGDGLGALYGLFRADPWSGVNFSKRLVGRRRPRGGQPAAAVCAGENPAGHPAAVLRGVPAWASGAGRFHFPHQSGGGLHLEPGAVPARL